MSKIKFSLELVAVVFLLGLCGCGDNETSDESKADKSDQGASPTTRESSASDHEFVDIEMPAYQRELIELAFESVSKLPSNPHIKNRCRFQARVVDDCIEMGLHGTALRLTRRVDNWQRGRLLADCALAAVERDPKAEVQSLLDAAEKLSDDMMSDAKEQLWRRLRIRVAIGRVHLIKGDEGKAKAFIRGVINSELGPIGQARARVFDAADFDTELTYIDGALKQTDFDIANNAILTCVTLYNRFYADADKRAALSRRVFESYPKLPVQKRYEAINGLTKAAIGHKDFSEAQRLITDNRKLTKGLKWRPRDDLRMRAELATLMIQAHDEPGARSLLDGAMSDLSLREEEIVNIWRADAVRPLAEAFAHLGDTANSQSLYSRVVEHGQENPNSKPRAEDLALTLTSMAKVGIEPTVALRQRIQQIADELGDPW